MPELLTQHPEVAIKVLKDAKIDCGTGAPQKILTTCPKEQFCSLPTGELCLYDTTQINQMTQIQPIDLFIASQGTVSISVFLLIVFLMGLWLGFKFK